MPAIKVSSQDLVTNLFTAQISPGALRRLIRETGTELLLCIDSSKMKLRQELAKCGVVPNLVLLELLVDVLSISNKADPQIENKRLRRLSVAHLVDLVDSEEWQTEVDKRSPLMISNSTREDVFGRTFGHLIGAGMEEFEIIDPYFMAKLLDGSQVIEWLLSQFSQRGLHNLTIKTKIQGNRNFAMMSEEVLIRSAAGALHSLKTKVGFEGKLKMELFRGFNHNRYFITTFRDGAFAFELGQGIDTFAREMVREGQKNHILSALEWKAIWGDTQMLTPHPSALRQANIDGVTSEVLIILAPKS